MQRNRATPAGSLGCLFGYLLAWVSHGAAPAEPQAVHRFFRPAPRVTAPAVRQAEWVRNPIDAFILAELEARGLRPAAPASREQLIRRISFGLIGLPPTPDQVDAFVHDDSRHADERLIDRLLASPHYGERWARHWLDLVRFAESDGFEHDALRLHAWRYRDYAIRSFNEDKPYDRFIREQLAGDELWPGDPEAIVATAFSLLGPDMVDSADQIQRRLNTLNDATDATASVFLGLTFGCARCHDHKFEPFSQRDYFQLQAFFAPALFEREWPVPTAEQRAAHEVDQAEYRARAASLQEQLRVLEQPSRERLYEAKLARLSEDAQLAHRTPKEKRTMEQEGTVQETLPMLKVSDTEVVQALPPADRARRKELTTTLDRIRKPLPLPMTLALHNTNGLAPKTFVLMRGDYASPGEEVQPGFPAALMPDASSPGTSADSRDAASPGSSPRARPHRAVLADWMVSPDNPLTARVMVNRLWQHHFGRGLVATPSDFGTRGMTPSHPGLLDWLAGEFIARGWSVKTMQKLILLSAAYQQSSVASPGTLAGDPDNRWFSRQNRVRLEGEAIRDSLLVISGRLNPQVGGPSVSPPIPSDLMKVSKSWVASANRADHARRSLYILARRNLRFPFLEVFDAPDNNLTCPERGRSTTAPQSLTLLNSEEVMSAAAATAQRLAEATPDPDARVDLAFRWALARLPRPDERALARAFVDASARRATPDALPPEPVGAEWVEFCRALFNLNAFVYVD